MGVQILNTRADPNRERNKQTRTRTEDTSQLLTAKKIPLFFHLLAAIAKVTFLLSRRSDAEMEENVFPIISRSRHGPTIFLTLLQHR